MCARRGVCALLLLLDRKWFDSFVGSSICSANVDAQKYVHTNIYKCTIHPPRTKSSTHVHTQPNKIEQQYEDGYDSVAPSELASEVCISVKM